MKVPFLRPLLPRALDVLDIFREIDESGVYSNFGEINSRFQGRIIKEWFGNEGHVVTINNATTALILAINTVKKPGGKYALMPSFTFAATPLAAQWCGLTPYFVDIVPGELSVSEHLIREVLNDLGNEVAVVVPYATFGSSLDLSFYDHLIKKGVPVVVDAAPCFGATDETGRHLGQGFNAPVVFSFHATKPFGIGEGGIIYSEDACIISQIKRDSNFGFGDDRSSYSMGLNGKLCEYMAAIGLKVLDGYREKLRVLETLALSYDSVFNTYGIFDAGYKPHKPKGNAVHQFYPLLAPTAMLRDECLKALAEVDIQARTYFSPACHQQVAFRNCPATNLEITESVSGRILSLPLWVGLSIENIKEISNIIKLATDRS